MKIGILTTSFPRHDEDIAGCFVLDSCKALVARGHTIQVLAPEPSADLNSPRWPNIEVKWIPYMRPRQWQNTFYGAGVPENSLDLAAWPGLTTYPFSLFLHAQRYKTQWDAVISHWSLPCGLVAAKACTNIPHVAFFHSADLFLLAKLPGRTWIANTLVKHCSGLWFVNHELSNGFEKLLPTAQRSVFGNKQVISPMPIQANSAPLQDRAELRRRWGMTNFTVLMLNRLVPIKGIQDAIDAIGTMPSAELWIAGEGPEGNVMQEYARSKRVAVRWLDTVTGGRRAELLYAADAFLSASRPLVSGRTEGTPTSLLHAMAAALPIVATNVGGVRDLLQNGKLGLVVPPANPLALVEALNRIKDDPSHAKTQAHLAQAAAEEHQWNSKISLLERFLKKDRAYEFQEAPSS